MVSRLGALARCALSLADQANFLNANFFFFRFLSPGYRYIWLCKWELQRLLFDFGKRRSWFKCVCQMKWLTALLRNVWIAYLD